MTKPIRVAVMSSVFTVSLGFAFVENPPALYAERVLSGVFAAAVAVGTAGARSTLGRQCPTSLAAWRIWVGYRAEGLP